MEKRKKSQNKIINQEQENIKDAGRQTEVSGHATDPDAPIHVQTRFHSSKIARLTIPEKLPGWRRFLLTNCGTGEVETFFREFKTKILKHILFFNFINHKN